ncbi:hypothetical protein NC651_019435 [Populus alba x Populus x berolinensis]|nr:hypothetical protein NC651_019435 [Populus alba x Populus x berolinensis]
MVWTHRRKFLGGTMPLEVTAIWHAYINLHLTSPSLGLSFPCIEVNILSSLLPQSLDEANLFGLGPN